MTSPILLGPDLLAMPPIDAVFDSAVGKIATTVYLTLALALFAWGMKQAQKRLIIAAMLFGGAITSSIEPLLDVVTGALHPIVGQDAMFTLMGRSIPLWVVVCYAIYYGGFGSLNLIAFIKGVSRRGVWLWFLAPLFGDVLWEEVMLHYKLYYYYGNQPFVLIKFPLYQPAGNSTGELLGVTALFFLRPCLTSAWRWFLAAAVVMPIAGVMGFNGVCWPGFYAVHSTWPASLVQLCGLLTWCLAALMVYVVSLLVGVDSPLRKEGRLTLS
jgi:hypothetical protein